MVIVLLALGVGVNVATFGIADELFLRQPPGVARPAELRRLVARSTRSFGGLPTIRSEFFYPAFRAIAEAVGGRASLAGYTRPDSVDSRIGTVRGFERVSYATPSFFSVLGVSMARGRFFSDAEGRMGAADRVAVISYDLWQTRYAAGETAIGASIDVAREPFTVIGVAPRDFCGIDLDRADIWLPFATMPYSTDRNWFEDWRMNSSLRIVARSAGGITGDAIAAIATSTYRRGEADHVAAGADTTAVILPAPLLESRGPSIHPSAEVMITPRLIGIAVIVLILACANVANLLLLRGLTRQREIAIRLALGISRGRLVGQLLLEGVVLSVVAALVSITVGAAGAALLRTMILPSVHWASGSFTPRLVIVAIVTAVATGIASSAIAAVGALDDNLTSALKSAARDGVLKPSRFRAVLLVVQSALSALLLMGAGLFARSLQTVRAIDVGYSLASVAYGSVVFRDPDAHFIDFYSDAHKDEIAVGLQVVAQRLESSPNIRATAFSQLGPMAGEFMTMVFTADQQPVRRVNGLGAAILQVSPSYFAVTGVSLVRGRLFTAADAGRDGRVVVVNETGARVIAPDHDVLGDCIRIARAVTPCSTVIGIVRDVRISKIIEPAMVQVLQPLDELDRHAKPAMLVVRARESRLHAALDDLRRELRRTFPTAEPPIVESASAAREPELRPWRLGTALFGTLGVLALVVASLGVYSVTAFSVKQRTHEIGIRMALGARASQMLRLVVVSAMLPIIVGALLGLGLSVAFGRIIGSMLMGTTPADPLVAACVYTLLMIAGVGGTLVPALRAARVDPTVALRAD
jgi:predicted permease